MGQSIWNSLRERNRVRSYGVTLLGVVVALALIAGLAAIYFRNAAATGPSFAESRIQGWVNQLGDEQLTPARHLAQQHLEEAGDAAVDPLISELHSPDSAMRRNSTEMLGFIASPRALDALTVALANDPVASVRSRAAWALGELHDLRAVSSLEIASVLDQDTSVRQEASGSLDALRSHLAFQAGKNGRITSAFAIAPGDPAIVYLAEMNQISISRDGGKTWFPAAGTPPSRVSALGVSPSNPNTLFAGTESMGLYESTDGGTTWMARNQGLGLDPGVRLTITAVAVDPQHPDSVYIAIGAWIGGDQASLTPSGIMVSLNGAATWQQANVATGSKAVTWLVIYGNELYAAAGDSVTSLPL